MKIMLNPDLWTVTTARADDETDHKHGEAFDVSDDEWAVLGERRSKQFGNRYRTWVEVDGQAPEAEAVWVRSENLMEMTKAQLKELAEARGLSTDGTKSELAERITEHESAEPAEGA